LITASAAGPHPALSRKRARVIDWGAHTPSPRSPTEAITGTAVVITYIPVVERLAHQG